MKNITKLILCIGLVFSFNTFANEPCPENCTKCAQQCKSGAPSADCKDACTTCKDNAACPSQ